MNLLITGNTIALNNARRAPAGRWTGTSANERLLKAATNRQCDRQIVYILQLKINEV